MAATYSSILAVMIIICMVKVVIVVTVTQCILQYKNHQAKMVVTVNSCGDLMENLFARQVSTGNTDTHISRGRQ